MKASELRIGNWVRVNLYRKQEDKVINLSENPRQVKGIYEKGVIFDEISFLNENKNLIPIPLTEEILLKAGFKKRIGGGPIGSYTRKRHSIHCGITHFQINHCLPFQYVHQLQNLYFALFGEELEIKL